MLSGEKQGSGSVEEESKKEPKQSPVKGLTKELEKVEEESEQQSVMHDPDNELKQSMNGLPSRHGPTSADGKSIEQIQSDLDKLR